MTLSQTLPFPRPDTTRRTDALDSLLQTQAAIAGQVWQSHAETVEFLAQRLRKDAAFVATLATTRLPGDAARLMFGHMQESWTDYAGQAMRLGTAWGAMMPMARGTAASASRDEAAPAPEAAPSAPETPPSAAPVPAQARAAGGGGKPLRSDPV